MKGQTWRCASSDINLNHRPESQPKLDKVTGGACAVEVEGEVAAAEGQAELNEVGGVHIGVAKQPEDESVNLLIVGYALLHQTTHGVVISKASRHERLEKVQAFACDSQFVEHLLRSLTSGLRTARVAEVPWRASGRHENLNHVELTHRRSPTNCR